MNPKKEDSHEEPEETRHRESPGLVLRRRLLRRRVLREVKDDARKLVSEALGTGLLLATVIGSGIMGERLSGGNAALALLADSLATGAVLVALILALGPVSGAHFNPVVTLCDAWTGGMPWGKSLGYVAAQVSGAFAGVAAAHAMYGLPLFSASRHARQGGPQFFSEFVATFGLVAVIRGCSRRPAAVPFAVGAYITAAYWFTASTSFANPAATLARAASDTFAGIRPSDTPAFALAQLLGAGTAAWLFGWLAPTLPVAAHIAPIPRLSPQAPHTTARNAEHG